MIIRTKASGEIPIGSLVKLNKEGKVEAVNKIEESIGVALTSSYDYGGDLGNRIEILCNDFVWTLEEGVVQVFDPVNGREYQVTDNGLIENNNIQIGSNEDGIRINGNGEMDFYSQGGRVAELHILEEMK